MSPSPHRKLKLLFGIVVACSSHLPPVLGVRCDAQAVKLFDFADLHLILRT
jgi:hypothetical protein